MKKLWHSFAFIILVNNLSIAQTTITEGKVTYTADLSGMNSSVAAMMGTMTIDIAFKGSKGRTDLNSKFTTMNTVSDATAGTGTILINVMGNKSYCVMGKDEFVKAQTSNGTYKIVYSTETKAILEHVCTKATITTNGSDVVYWIANDIIPANDYLKQYSDLKGFPLEFSTNENGSTIKYTATEIKTAGIDDATFIVDTTGYTLKTYDQIAKMGGK